MPDLRSTAADIDAYIAEFPPETQKVLQEIRELIRANAPGATETISYAMPTFDLNGRHLVHFAGYARHIGFYPIPTGMEAFKDEPDKTQRRKLARQAARSVLPNATETKIFVTANARALRHFIEMRGSSLNVPRQSLLHRRPNFENRKLLINARSSHRQSNDLVCLLESTAAPKRQGEAVQKSLIQVRSGAPV